MNKRLTYELLFDEYVNKIKPMWLIAKEQNVAIGTIFNYIKKFNIPARARITEITKRKISNSQKGKPSPRKGVKVSKETRLKMSLSKKGKFRTPTKYGGHRKQNKDGYIAIFIPSHPRCNKEGYVFEHHLVMEEELGRYIEKGEVVHHKNHIRDDNRIENLELMSFKDHARLHMIERQQRRRLLSIK